MNTITNNQTDATANYQRAQIVTTRKLNTLASRTSVEFLQEFFPEVLEKGYSAAEKMVEILQGKKVRRSYYFTDPTQPSLAPITLYVQKVESQDAGIVRIYDLEETVREFPALMFDFVFTEKSVACIGQQFTVVFEVF